MGEGREPGACPCRPAGRLAWGEEAAAAAAGSGGEGGADEGAGGLGHVQPDGAARDEGVRVVVAGEGVAGLLPASWVVASDPASWAVAPDPGHTHTYADEEQEEGEAGEARRAGRGEVGALGVDPAPEGAHGTENSCCLVFNS
jgi:hypothetical protein